MPIRFRCAYCKQLMGIARRKAGTVVRCPKCDGQVIVPKPPSDSDDKPAKKSSKEGNGGVFDAADFDQVFDEPKNEGGAVAAPPKVAPVPVQGTDVEYMEFPDEPEGCFLTAGKLLLLGVIVLLLIALAFVAGLLIGRASAPSAHSQQSTHFAKFSTPH